MMEIENPRIEIPLDIGRHEKAWLSGEHRFQVQRECPVCAYLLDEPDENCEVCEGNIVYNEFVIVPWTTIKEIRRDIAKLYKPANLELTK
jgi:hypothetical protein